MGHEILKRVVFVVGGVVFACSMTIGSGIRDTVETLAGEVMQGRLTGSAGERLAADFLARQLKELGARPLPGFEGYQIPFEFTAGMRDGGSSVVVTSSTGEARTFKGVETVQALSFSDNSTVTGEVVFAGYGLSLPEGEDVEYNSYVGLDVKDKIVLVLRYVPEDVDAKVRSTLSRYSGLRYKALYARELGARAVLFVSGPRSPNAGKTIPVSFDTALSGSGIVAASISDEVVALLWEGIDDRTLEAVQEALDTGNPHVSGFALPGVEISIETAVVRERRTGYNVVGHFPAAAETDTPSWIVLGAHYDHLGHGNNGNSLASGDDVGAIHNGADDNASGVAAVLDVARRLSKTPLPRPVAFCFWSGEELGLLGSTHFIKESGLDAESISAYANFDMVGRMQDNRLTLQSMGSSAIWPSLVERSNVPVGFDINTQSDPYVPTDASVFYQAGIPTLNFFTGSHEDYHRPTDDVAAINFEDLERVAQFATLVTRKLAALETDPEWVKVDPPVSRGGDRDGLRAFTGTIPDYTTEVEGLKLSGVVGGGPAELAGIRGGDVIVEFAGQKITNIYDYTYALDAVKIDIPVVVIVVRDGERLELELTPTAR